MTRDALSRTVVAAPPLAALVLVAGFLGGEALGFRPFDSEPLNVSEAAAMGAAAGALRFMADGSDPNVARPIAAGVLGSLPRSANAINAAILGRRPEMISLLLQHGAAVTDADRSRCLAEAVGFPEALPLLGMTQPESPVPTPNPQQPGDPVGACLHEATE